MFHFCLILLSQENLLKENASLSNTVRKLTRDVSKVQNYVLCFLLKSEFLLHAVVVGLMGHGWFLNAVGDFQKDAYEITSRG